MNKLEENKQNFCIDKNKQDIRRLEKRTREHDEDIAALNQFKTKTDTDLTSVKSDIEALQNSSSTEEKIELMSYDCYKTNERIYRDTCWLPRPIAFCAESGKMFKFRVKFNAVSTFETAITSTATIKFDDEQIFSDTQQIPAGGTHAVDFEHSTSSERGGHKLVIELRNTETPAVRTECCIPDLLTVELWGTNVQFVTRNNDFAVIPAGDKVVMTTMMFNQPHATYSMQTADSNLSLSETAFNWLKTNDYRNYNCVLPVIQHTFDEDENKIVYFDEPSLLIHQFATNETSFRIGYYWELTANNTSAVAPYTHIKNSYCVKMMLGHSDNTLEIKNKKVHPDFTYLALDGHIRNLNKGLFPTDILVNDVNSGKNIELTGVVRLDNTKDKNTMYVVVTRQDGTSFFSSKQIITNSIPCQQLELGFGTHANAYLVDNDEIYVFLKIGKNIKKIVLEPDTNGSHYKFNSSEIIKNVQEYWLTPNGSHFERFGNKIKYYSNNSNSPSQTLTTFC